MWDSLKALCVFCAEACGWLTIVDGEIVKKYEDDFIKRARSSFVLSTIAKMFGETTEVFAF